MRSPSSAADVVLSFKCRPPFELLFVCTRRLRVVTEVAQQTGTLFWPLWLSPSLWQKTASSSPLLECFAGIVFRALFALFAADSLL